MSLNSPRGHAGSRPIRHSRRLGLGLISLLLVLVGGTLGYVAFGYGVLDAVFQTVITVGFGEVHRFGTGQKVFTIALILTGVGSAAYTFTVAVETLLDGDLADEFGRRRMERQIRQARDHVVLCGWGRVGRAIASSLRSAKIEVVVIDSSAERAGTVDGPSLCGDATDEDATGIDRAAALITALNGDADNLYVTLTARSMRPDLFIVSRTASESAIGKLLQAGADRVVNPQDLGGARMAALATQPHVAEFLDVVMHDGSLEFRLEQVDVPPSSPLAGQTLRSARVHARSGALVLALRHPDRSSAGSQGPESIDLFSVTDFTSESGNDPSTDDRTANVGGLSAWSCCMIGHRVREHTRRLLRNNLELCPAAGDACGMAVAVDVVEGLAAKFAALLPHLDERQRRLALGAEARSLGHGGVKAVAEAAGVSAVTVSAGVAELEAGHEPLVRARRPGGGRKKLAVTDPGLKAALLALVEPSSRGDPESPLRWTTRSLRNLAAELGRAGHRASAPTVAGLLREEHFSLQGNARAAEGRQHPDRDAQFRHISEQARAHQAAGQPVVSVDARKKENVGNFRNGGREWRPGGDPERVNVHDFIGKELGKAVPYGVYDIAADAGWVSVGTDHDTAAFAVQTIRTWWQTAGQPACPDATRLLICADGGGSNGYRTRLWKTELAALAAGTGLEITVCHFPPGTSKWNKIEHRLFSHISMNWRGRPLTSHEVIVSLIADTRTRTGLTVAAELDPGQYPKGIKISDREMRDLEQSRRLRRHDWHPEWNYCLSPVNPP
jgi:voltage-gated potassium channel Kch